jgi:hypothetical protein
MTEAGIKFVERLSAVYGPPKTENVEQFAREYSKALDGFTAEELRAASDALLMGRKFSSWPTIAECMDAASLARKALNLAADGKEADVKGTGWRVSSSGKRWFRIERGSKDYDAWLKFYRDNGRSKLAKVIDKDGVSFVSGQSPAEHGGAMLAYLDDNRPKERLAQ